MDFGLQFAFNKLLDAFLYKSEFIRKNEFTGCFYTKIINDKHLLLNQYMIL